MALTIVFENGDEIKLDALTLDEAIKKCMIMFPHESFKIVGENNNLLFICKY